MSAIKHQFARNAVFSENQNSTVWLQYAANLGEELARIVGMMERFRKDHEIEILIGEAQVAKIAQAKDYFFRRNTIMAQNSGSNLQQPVLRELHTIHFLYPLPA